MLLGEAKLGDRPVKYGGRLTPGCGNLMIERSVFEQIGMFERTVSGRGEDTDLFSRIEWAGIAAWYLPDAIVHHLTPAERLETRIICSIWHGAWARAWRCGKHALGPKVRFWRCGWPSWSAWAWCKRRSPDFRGCPAHARPPLATAAWSDQFELRAGWLEPVLATTADARALRRRHEPRIRHSREIAETLGFRF